MLRKISLAALAGVLAVTSLTPALAGKPGSGTMPAQSEYGLCKAAFSGSENGQANKRKAPPFQDLFAKAQRDGDQDGDDDFDWDDVAIWCQSKTPGGKPSTTGSARGSRGR